jgi:hypothetical protein
VRNDGCLLLEARIRAGVVLVKVGIDDEPHRLIRNALERSLNSLGQGSVLVVDHNNPVLSYRCPDVAAFAFQHVNSAGHFRDLHLDFAEVLILAGGLGAGKQQ